MIRKFLMVGLVATVLGIFPTANAVQAHGVNSSEAVKVTNSVKVRSLRLGPFATLQRANEVANYARRLGYNASIFYAGSYIYGTRTYYVDVW